MTNKYLKDKKTFSRRSLILGSCKAILFSGLLGRMFHLQILNHTQFSKLSEKNHSKISLIVPSRGRILARNNEELAANIMSYQLSIEKLGIEQDSDQIIKKICDILGYPETQELELRESFYPLKVGEELLIEQNLKWKELLELELNIFDLLGSEISVNFNRTYPYAELFGHTTGYLGSPQKLVSSLPSKIKIGKNGIEKTMEEDLKGKLGERKLEVNAKGHIIREISLTPSAPGNDIKLTLDLDLQKKATELLQGNTGVALLAKIETGEILASVSLPSYDPNLFSKKISAETWDKLINNPELPLIDRTVALTYPPGSAFKINVAIAAVKNNFSPETRFFCPGYYTLGNRKFQCWHKNGHGSLNLYEAIAGSCNVYFWNVAKILGIQPFADMARIMGFDQKILQDSLPREQKGLIPDPEWKRKNKNSSWNMADTLNSAIGQGYIEATPIQMLTMIMRIASGKNVTPFLVKNNNINTSSSLNISKELEIIKRGMEMTTRWERGTAFNSRINISGMEMAGKTGTCQVISKRHANDDLSKAIVPKKIRNHGVFVAYAPLNSPKYAFCGIIEHGGTPLLAVKTARDLLIEAQKRNI